TPEFGSTEVEVVSQSEAVDRGDGSGSYHLVTTATDESLGVSVQHELGIERDGYGEVREEEALRALKGKEELFRGESDPSVLGPWSDAALTYAVPFDLDFWTDSPSTYHARDKQIKQIVQAVVPNAEITTRGGSDGRTRATIRLPDVQPVNELAKQFVAIRAAFHDADVGLAKMQIEGRAVAPHEATESAASSEPGS
ncbi:MAG: hypothetical protein P8Y29_03755, partial [Gemmatimonadota bacterium]